MIAFPDPGCITGGLTGGLVVSVDMRVCDHEVESWNCGIRNELGFMHSKSCITFLVCNY